MLDKLDLHVEVTCALNWEDVIYVFNIIFFVVTCNTGDYSQHLDALKLLVNDCILHSLHHARVYSQASSLGTLACLMS